MRCLQSQRVPQINYPSSVFNIINQQPLSPVSFYMPSDCCYIQSPIVFINVSQARFVLTLWMPTLVYQGSFFWSTVITPILGLKTRSNMCEINIKHHQSGKNQCLWKSQPNKRHLPVFMCFLCNSEVHKFQNQGKFFDRIAQNL